jgi:hypothetical protein
MGSLNYRKPTKEEIEEHKRWQAERDAKRLAEIERFAMKCTTIAVDNIITDIVRPGPKPEERECYDVANEIREHKEKIIAEIAKAIVVEAKEGALIKSEYGWIERAETEWSKES